MSASLEMTHPEEQEPYHVRIPDNFDKRSSGVTRGVRHFALRRARRRQGSEAQRKRRRLYTTDVRPQNPGVKLNPQTHPRPGRWNG